MSQIVLAGICGVAAYFIGNISPSTILAKRQGIDIKSEGSGNAGTTNALRVMGKKAGAVTCIVDILKGLVAVLIGTILAGSMGASICGLMVFLGHVWPAIYKFKGGKGVATTFGSVLGISPLAGLVALLIVAICVFTSKRMSVGSIIGAATLPLVMLFFRPWYVWVSVIIAVVVIVQHRANISRLIKGEEPVMGIFKQPEDKEESEDRTPEEKA